MKVEFTIYTRSGKKASGGILVYKHANKSGLTPDALDSNGYAETKWTDRWRDEKIDVYCHTDGVNSGTAAFAGTVTIKPHSKYELKCK